MSQPALPESAIDEVPQQLVSHLPDADMQASSRALMRAARSAREIARRTGTKLVIVRDGVLVEEAVEEEVDDADQSYLASTNHSVVDADR